VFYNDTDANEDAGDYPTVNGVRAGTEAAGGTFSATGGTGIKGIYGTLVLEDYGDYTYTLDNADPDTQALKAGQTAADVFTYRIVDTQGLTDTAQITINVSGTNDVPVITSNGGGATAAVSVAENSTLVTTIAATDPDSTVIFALAGNDSSKFKLVGNQLHFVAAPDFEVRGDANADNVYDVTVFAADGTTLDTQALSVTVTNVNEAPVISSNGGGATAAVTVTENTALVTTLAAADPDGTAVTYSLTGADAAKFKLVGAQVQFVTPVDFDTRTDANGDGTYEVTVVASDGVLTDTQAISVGVTNIAGNTVNGTKKADKIDGTHKVKGLGATGEEDYINGKKGNDVIKGLDGNDTLVGGDGKDTITGGGGVDFFAFSAKLTAANADTIKDFVHDVDLIHLADSVFKTLGTALEAREFYAKKGAVEAHDKNDRIIYDKKTGNLYYDDDGNKVGGHDAVLFATLSTKPLIDAGDFAVVCPRLRWKRAGHASTGPAPAGSSRRISSAAPWLTGDKRATIPLGIVVNSTGQMWKDGFILSRASRGPGQPCCLPFCARIRAFPRA
jgi:VCBS repeat-containing protein